MTKPATQDIEIMQGDSFDLFFRVKARDAGGTLVYQNQTGNTCKAQYRATKSSASPVLVEFVCSMANQTTTPGGWLIHATPALTAGLSPTTNGVWDVEISYANGDKKTVLAGAVTVFAQVTQ